MTVSYFFPWFNTWANRTQEGRNYYVSYDGDAEKYTDKVSSFKHQPGGMVSIPLDSDSMSGEQREMQVDTMKKGMGSLIVNKVGDVQYLGKPLLILVTG